MRARLLGRSGDTMREHASVRESSEDDVRLRLVTYYPWRGEPPKQGRGGRVGRDRNSPAPRLLLRGSPQARRPAPASARDHNRGEAFDPRNAGLLGRQREAESTSDG